MPFFDANIQKQVKDILRDLREPVAVLFFGSQTQACEYCEPTLALLQELVPLSDKLSLEVYDIDAQPDQAARFHVDKIPGIVLAAKTDAGLVDYGIRYAGIPAGHEFTALIQDLLLVSRRDSGLSPATRDFLSRLDKPVHLQVFVTPTWPHCPRAVVLAHQMAFESAWVQAESVEASEFMELSNEYGVSGVPHTSINFGAGEMIGSAPEAALVNQIKHALDQG